MMFDFIEYVVAELKSKRLSKMDAAALVRQFSRRGATAPSASVIHPLLQRNTSDLSEQRYSSIFTGEEFFLAGHQVKANGQAAQKVLPGVAYLEMARAAIEQASPERPQSTLLELRNTVWARPIVVGGEKQVNIVLFAGDDDKIDYEVYCDDAGGEIVHCQGLAVFAPGPAPARLQLGQLEMQMGQGELGADSVYAMCARMGLLYGSALRAITAIHRGSGQLLAHLRLPGAAADGSRDYVLHPSLMDGALQAAVGLMESSSDWTRARVPFALETLRIVSPCVPEMVAWVRYAAGSGLTDNVVKLDIDLCDGLGNVCVQMHGFSSRVISQETDTASPMRSATGSLLATPVWQASGAVVVAGPAEAEYAGHHVVLCELSRVEAGELATLLPRSQCLSLRAVPELTLAQRYAAHAVACFERLQTVIQSRPQGKVLVQIVVPADQEQALLAGLSGLLKTAALENPHLAGQLILVPAGTTAGQLAVQLEQEQRGPLDALVRYEDGSRQVLRWQEVPEDQDRPPVAFHDDGVYLITGGLGGLGILFAKEILERTRRSRIVLTGRAALNAERQARIDGLSADGGRLSYRQLDLADLAQVRHLIAGIQAEYGRLNGILHGAGMIADQFIAKKDGADFSNVLAPKVAGTFNLDQASAAEELDFFVLFSSMAGALGNPGQGDYAAANGFLDQFAAYRNRQVAERRRHGRTRSINWPLWQAGGMGIDPATQELLQRTVGMQPMRTATGLDAFHRAVALPYDQIMVVEGDRDQIRRALLGAPAPVAAPRAARPVAAVAIDPESLAEKTQDYLRKQMSGLLKLPVHEIDPRAALENYGIDSILAMKLTNQLETTFGSLSKTLFFEYQTIRELTEYFIAHHAAQLTALLAPAANRQSEALPAAAPVVAATPSKLVAKRRFSRQRNGSPGAATETDPIAIIGLSGRYPEAADIDTYWQNLRAGKDCITEVPKERWDWREYFTDDRSLNGHHYSKWGGFISGVDEFDPLFFNISPADAEYIDPQERLFLQHAWMAMEDAGYTRAGLQAPSPHDLPGQVGVYVGVMYTEYQLFGAEAAAQGRRLGIVGSAASISNRVSYALNLHGPSMTLDTMCSSSLTAIHVACQDLKQGRTSLAIAGGVNVTIHPNKYLVLSAGQFISSDGHCQSFGEGGDGYIPGEGVGVVILKRLSEAKRDGDHIYGIIRGSALTHGGKTNGYSVPNPQAQTSAISRALKESLTDPRHISYIEAHGTGTKLGDPIEIAALSKAFRQSTQDTGFCLIGSAKSNIGHCESAAGIAGLTKVLLQLQHREIVPSLHSAQLNPHIDFPASPFVVNQAVRTWEQPEIDGRQLPRIAGISSFGAGGSNAHMIVEEYQSPVGQPMPVEQVVILLTAKTAEQLRQRARDLFEFVQPRLDTIDLAAMAFTLQVGREAMDERLGLVVSSADQLVEKLQAWLAREQGTEPGIEDVYHGQVKRNSEALSLFSTDADLQQTVDRWVASRKLPKLLDLWVKGLEVDWSRLYGETKPRRLSLPTYPFARERYWIDVTAGAPVATKVAVASLLHPLLHSNTSDFSGQRYLSTFTGEEFFLADHQVTANGNPGQKVLPGVAYLEMARAAIEHALSARSESTVLELLDTVWAQPIVISGNRQVGIALVLNDEDSNGNTRIDFEIYTQDGEQATIHCQGRAVLSHAPQSAPLDLEQLEAQMSGSVWESARVYAACARLGLIYGPSFQGITSVHQGSRQLLARLRLPDTVEGTAAAFVLHPSLLDGALQAAVALTDGSSAQADQPRLPFALDTLRIVSPCTPGMVAWLRYAPGSGAGDPVIKLDIDLCDERGNVCVQMRGFSSRVVGASLTPAIGTLLAAPVWQPSAVQASLETGRSDGSGHHIILCELPTVDVRTLELTLSGSQCVSLAPQSAATLAQRYSEYAIACFERIQQLIQGGRQGQVLIQVVVPDRGDQAVLSGLSGLLRTAALENPQLLGQVVMVPPATTTEELGRLLRGEKAHMRDALVRYEHGVRQVLGWQEVAAEPATASIAFKDPGVYLITGGLGALGLLFAREILEQTRDARVILTGRAALTGENQAHLDGLFAQRSRVSYRQLDLGDLDQVKQFMAALLYDYRRLDGILHSAGMIADRFILKKTSAEFREVLAPKVAGTFNLDQASRFMELDFFVLFSSIAGAVGNPGQVDYAAANAFMDQFAAYRNRQVAAKERRGRTRSINWPLWQAGGMAIDPAGRELLQQTTGMQPMQTAAGMAAFHRSLALPHDQVLVVEGDLVQIRRALLAGAALPVEPRAEAAVGTAGIDAGEVVEKTQDYLRKELAGPLKMASGKIDPYAPMEQYGIDSILALKLTSQLEKTFGPLSKTLFFEYQTIHALAGYFIARHSAQLMSILNPAAEGDREMPAPAARALPSIPARLLAPRRFSRIGSASPGAAAEADPIAIIGLSGRYPEAPDIETYWRNLRDGKDCITEVPEDRWDWREYFTDDRSLAGHHYSKWGGFIAGVDEFDPLFFNMSPLEAELVDPQERLFLQHAWMAIEDAGYTRAGLQVHGGQDLNSRDLNGQDLNGQVGVYAGVMYNEYQLFGAEAGARGKRLGIPGSPASIANRVSYALNLHGPSMTLDTMCSSSLTAIHIACLELKLGRTDLAIAGGVNVTIHPNKYLVLSAGQFISSDGHCQSFGEGGDGYIPGEGVGVVVLKRLSDARRDGDHIYGLIRGSALNHGGKTNGYTVPNPQAQAGAIRRALAESGTDPRHVSYIEAHGTGTKLGDPIEIAALSHAFHDRTQDTAFCMIGSAKSNIGHCESAAGIAGLTKVLLQMQHQQIVPSLHSAQLNPHIDFQSTPFTVNQVLQPWERPVIDGRTLPRIAGISSFGAGGSNAHMIVEEYPQPVRQTATAAKVVILLSARTPEQLRQKAGDLLEFVQQRVGTIDLPAVAYTLQVGREPMEERLGFVVSSAGQLTETLAAYLAGDEGIEDVYQGQAIRNNPALMLLSTDADLKQAVDKWIGSGKISKLLELWVSGLEVDWSRLYGDARPLRVSLPAYPFARERYWIDMSAAGPQSVAGATALLHPLLHSNTSDLNGQRYRSTFTGSEFFLADHQVSANGLAPQKVLPAVAYLEMARAAIQHASPADPESTVLEFRNIVWAEPIVVAGTKTVDIDLAANDYEQGAASDMEIDYEIYSQDSGREIVHGQGRAVRTRQQQPAPLDLAQLRAQMDGDTLEPGHVYSACARMGLLYGATFQGITAIHLGTDQLLAELRLPPAVERTFADYVLHPSMMDSAVHACVALSSELAGQPRVPFALDLLRVVSPCTPDMTAWVRLSPGGRIGDSVVKVDIDLSDERGNVCVQLHGLSSRALGKRLAEEIRSAPAAEQAFGSLLATPVWQASAGTPADGSAEPVEHHVIVCELPHVDAMTLESALPQASCLALQAAPQQTVARRYSDYAVACFERVRTILQSRPKRKVLVHIVIPDHQEQTLLAGLSGLLKTAALENPKFIGQLLLVPAGVTAAQLAQHLQDEKTLGLESLVRYQRGARQILRWQEVADGRGEPQLAFKDDGVYLLTGGLGGLGVLFAKEILERSSRARIVLTGRSELTPEKRAVLEVLGHTGRVTYRKLDLDLPDDVEQVIAGIIDEFHQLNGVLHSAGMISDHFILKKSGAEFSRVLAPKVTGTFNLDRATRGLELDFFVLFSSVAGALGNLGQADYATANGFMDQFAAYRNRQVAAGQRQGRTLSINWPMWQAGGMAIDPAGQELLQQTTGMQPMQTATGLQAFHRSLSLPYDQVMVVEGDLAQMRRALAAGRPIAPQPSRPALAAVPVIASKTPAAETGSGSLQGQTQDYLRGEFAGLLKLQAHKIDPHAALEKYGIDSVLAMRLTNQLEKTFGSLSKTLFYEYQTIAGLAGYFVKAHPDVVRATVRGSRETAGFPDQEPAGNVADRTAIDRPAIDRTAIDRTPRASARRSRGRGTGSRTAHHQEIAIIGVAGRYPQAENLQEFWRNLQDGRDCITEVPPGRWDHALYFDPDPNKAGKSYTKWGGFLTGVDQFDPLFFNISPKEAAIIDPQERLFLETAWQTVEDAGYTRESISGGRVGVYVGVMWGHYELFGAESILRGNSVLSSSSYGSVANRVSYFFDFHGPSIALDTMCSSSLTAIHLACEELRKGEIEAAIAGGVNLTIHPYKYVSLSQGRFVATDGKCRSFGEGGDGYVPGEGVGAVLLKPLENALRDGDQVYAVIKSSALNHGGKTNGYSVPNPNAQADLIRQALDKARIDPRTLSYIETHGTGTSLGDPIEITGLSKAFEGAAGGRQFCAIGSVKSNIGHLESAAGIAAVTKALLQIRHKQLVPSLHADPLNPNIDFAQSPFYVQTALTDWPRPADHPRRVGVSSFGAGGSNAHLILEEYGDAQEPGTGREEASPAEAFVLSARDPNALRRYAASVVHFLESASAIPLADVAYTSQVGRTPMDARLVVITSGIEDLRGKLDRWIALQGHGGAGSADSASELEDVFYGNLREAPYGSGNLIQGVAGKAFLDDLLTNRELGTIARLWIQGVDIDWSRLDRTARAKRITLPTYPFARERYWVDQETPASLAVRNSTPETGNAATDERTTTSVAPRPANVQARPANVQAIAPDRAEAVDPTALLTMTETYLKALIGDEIKLDPSLIGSSDPFESFGIDSVMINRLNTNLERDLGALPKTLLYEHETVRDLAKFLLQQAHEALMALFGKNAPAAEQHRSAGMDDDEITAEVPSPGASDDPADRPAEARPVVTIEEQTIPRKVPAPAATGDLEPIAIIGIHGSYPHSATAGEYWENLKQGKDLIDLVPANRWDYEEFYHPDPAAAADGKIYCKWGGFLTDHDKFDPQFFRISTAEAKVIDPQERLFLASVWSAIEDAGYTRDSLRARFPKAGSADVGVFVGVTTNSYLLWAPEERARGNFLSPTAMPWSIANRVSYFFDFNGPSLPIDTACSSSLVALDLACESLRKGDCQVAIAGGVNLYLHPSKYHSLCQKRMLSLDGKCHSYGAGDDGFVPGEGVGTLVLKPLGKAIEDRDHVYAVIRASAFDHGGRSNGYSAPNPNSQARLISHTLAKANVHPDTIGYVEGHGTGTQLGDSLEIAALTQAFRTQTTKTQFCPIGSVKANIGHSESAAGIAGVAKIILQMEHGQLAPSIHSDERNPNIDLDDSPFYLQHGLSEWPSSDHPRRALINSFGAGGVNACVILEEFKAPASVDGSGTVAVDARAAGDSSGQRGREGKAPEPGPWLFILSARNEDRLKEYVDHLLASLRGERAIDLASLCYTLQVGREAMEERLAIVVSGVAQLIEVLGDWSRRGAAAEVHRGSLGPRRGSRRSSRVLKKADLTLVELASRWVAGEDVEWESLYAGTTPSRISVPTYPFARDRYWVSDSLIPERQTPSSARLHPLIAYNSSNLQDVGFTSELSDAAFYAVDHRVHQERVFPGAGFLEMACIAGNIAGEQRVRRIQDVVWMQPLSFRTGVQALRTALRPAGGGVEFAISSFDDDSERIVHCEGKLAFGTGEAGRADAGERVGVQALKARCGGAEAGTAFYDKFAEFGLHYGPSFRTVQELYVHGSFALAKLKIADHLRGEFDQFVLHPGMIDGALQTVAALMGSVAPQTPYLPFALDEIDLVRPLPQVCYAYAERAGASAQNHAGVTKFNIRLLNESGDVLVRFTNLYVRPIAQPAAGSQSSLAAGAGSKGRLLSLSRESTD